jgi:hypothetical protein
MGKRGKGLMKGLLSYIPNNILTYTSITLAVVRAMYTGRLIQSTHFKPGDGGSIYIFEMSATLPTFTNIIKSSFPYCLIYFKIHFQSRLHAAAEKALLNSCYY